MPHIPRRPHFRDPDAGPRRVAGRVLLAMILAAALVVLQTVRTLEAAPSPLLQSAYANDASGGLAGIQAGDQVVLRFNASTNAFSINSANINTVLALSGGHSWRDGSAVIGAAAWSTTAATNDTLTITLSITGGAPTVALGDSITIGPGTIRDISGVNDASGNGVTVGGAFNNDELEVSAVSAAPAFATRGTAGVVMERLTLQASSNAVTVTQLTIAETGTALDADFAAGGVKVYHDVNKDGAVNGGDVLLGSAAVAAGTATVNLSLGVASGTPQDVLLVVDLAAGAVPTRTVLVGLASAASAVVNAPDTVRNVNFPATSGATIIAAPAPQLLSATANANGNGGSGVQTGDRVVLVFDSTTNAPALTGATIDSALPLNNSHLWRDGSGAITSAVWSTTTVANDTLTVTFSTAGIPPSIAVGDTVSLGSVIQDISGGNNATGPGSLGGTFGADTLSMTATNRAPAAITLGGADQALLQLTLTADYNQIVVTSVRVDRTGTALDGDTIAAGVKIHDDIDDDGVLDAGEPLLGGGTFVAGSVTIAIAKSVAASAPENVLVVVSTNAAGTPGRTLGVTLTAAGYLGVSAGDGVNGASFPVASSTALLAGPPPALLSATAVDLNGGQPGVQAGDQVVIRFDRTTNAFAVNAGTINTVLALNNGHTWLDGAFAIGAAAWTQTTVPNDTLIITLAATAGTPTVALGDALTIGAGTIRDVTGANSASGSPPTISGAFGDDQLTVSAVNLAPAAVDKGGIDIPFLRLTLTASTNTVVASSLRLDRTGASTDADVASNGVKLWHDLNDSGTLDGADTLLATGSFSSGTVTLTAAIAVTAGTPKNYFVTLSINSGATLLRTLAVNIVSNTYLSVAAGDRVSATNFPISSTAATVVAPSPVLIGFVATDASGNGQGTQAGDQVALTFSSSTNAPGISAANIDALLVLNNGHSWRDGAGAIASAVWSTTTYANDTLTITVSATTSAPTVAPGDTVTITPATIQDVTGTRGAIGSPPSLSGSFGDDVLSVAGFSLTPSMTNENTPALVMERLTLTAATNTVVVTGLRLDRLGTADDTGTQSGGVKVYLDLDADDVIDGTDTLLASGAFTTGTVTLVTPVTVIVGAPRRLLLALDIGSGAGRTIGVGLLNTSYVLVASGDAVANTNFAVLSAIATIAARSPQITTASAADASKLGEGITAGDTVTLIFNGPTNGLAIHAGNIDTVLTLNNSHSWLDGSGGIGTIVWTTSVFPNDTLTITLTATTTPPTVAVGDTITIPASTIRDVTNTNNAAGSPPPITGTFGRDTLTVAAVGAAPATFRSTDGDVPLLRMTASASTNSVKITAVTVTIKGTVQATDFASSGGIVIYQDKNANSKVDAGDVTLGQAVVSGTSATVTLALTVTKGTTENLLITARLKADAVVGRTAGVEVASVSALTVLAPDVVGSDPFPLKSTEATLVDDAPTMIAALAVDVAGGGGSVQSGDQVIIVFSAGTNGLKIDAANINSVLALDNSHSWLSAGGTLGAAVWSTGLQANDTLTVTLSASGGAPSVRPGDKISIGKGLIKDRSGQVDAATTARVITGSFGAASTAPAGTVVTLIDGVGIARQPTTLPSPGGRHAVVIPAAAAEGDLVVTVRTAPAAPAALPAGAAIGESPLAVSLRYAATGLTPSALPAPVDLVVTPPAAELGGLPATALAAYTLSAEATWMLAPSWVDREKGAIHVALPGDATVAIAAVQPRTVTLTPGWNLVTFTGAPATPVDYLFRNATSAVDAIHRWNGAAGRYDSAFPLAPSFSTLTQVQPLDALWIHVRGEASVDWARYGGPLPAATLTLHPGWNLTPWVGAEMPFTQGAAGLFGLASAFYRWDAAAGQYDAFFAAGAPGFNTLRTLRPLDGLWVYVTADAPVTWTQPGLAPAPPPEP